METKPVVRKQPVWWHLFDVTVLEPLEQPFRVVRPIRKLAGVPVRALNLREGEVPDTAFFTNRDPAGLSPDAVRWGPTQPGDLVQPPVTITKAKTEGKTPGFFGTDAKGDRYLFKLDPVEAPELLSGAEIVTSKLLYALGYHVPSYEVTWVSPEELSGTPAELQAQLEGRVEDGRVRMAASKLLDGEILGPARFKRFRDCADVRALRLSYAWVNNTDTKDHNSLLVWDGRRTVGYLIDFGTSLGADAGEGGPKGPCAGWLHIVDLGEASLKLMTFGLHRPSCDASPPVSPGVGRFTAHLELARWKPYAPNLAFEEMNHDDARWMAGRMARLTRTQVEAAVSAGQYRSPEDAAYLVEVLEQRRVAIVRRYLKEERAAR